jgi:F-type H+-transporting ATPase subunit gamma
MQTLESLKRSIQSAEDLASVVRTMKTLAAVSIRQYEVAVESLGDYFATVEDGLRMLLWNSDAVPKLSDPVGRSVTGAIIFGSDQGMCGQFNEQVVTSTLEEMQRDTADGDSEWVFLTVGLRVTSRLVDHGQQSAADFSMAGSATAITPLVQDLLRQIDILRVRKHLGRVLLFHNRRQSASSWRPHCSELLPITPDRFSGLRQHRWSGRTLPSFTMDRSQLLSSLIRQYLFVSLFRVCAESLAGENASRIASMQAAERNISDRLAELKQGYNQMRQTAITEELLDVVTGFEALQQKASESPSITTRSS